MIHMNNIVKQYKLGGESIYALDHVSLHVGEGEYVAIIGPSGSGKSTLMNIIGCLDTPTSGEYILHGRRVDQLDENQLSTLRNKEIGFIFQSFQLLPRQDALSNVELPLIYAGMSVQKRRQRAEEMLCRVGLEEKLHHMPNQLSGGQQQRVSIGRALMNAPAVVLADEPTGNLDSKNSQEIVELLKKSNREYGQTLIVITHDESIALQADRILAIEDGRIVRDEVIR